MLTTLIDFKRQGWTLRVCRVGRHWEGHAAGPGERIACATHGGRGAKERVRQLLIRAVAELVQK